MIIGINGKIGSGKDTVGSIIQYLTSKEATSKGSYSHCQEMGLTYTVDYEIKKFAGKLKEVASLLTGIDIEDFEDQEFKKLEMPECWNKMQQSGRSKVWLPMTYRQFLQELGTEAMRDGLHTNVWVNALFADYKPPKMSQYNPSNWIITDMRFENELEAVVKHKGIAIRVVRPERTLTGTHPSEIALDGFIMHYEIINDGTIEDLVEKVKEILIKENII
jgi:uncharacterized protein (UPF0179 family)